MIMASVSQQHLYSVVKYFVLVVSGPVCFLFDGFCAPVTIAAVAIAVALTHLVYFIAIANGKTLAIHSTGNGLSDSNIPSNSHTLFAEKFISFYCPLIRGFCVFFFFFCFSFFLILYFSFNRCFVRGIFHIKSM